MALLATHGYFKTGTGAPASTVVVTGVGFEFKWMIIMWNGRTEIVNATSLQSHHRGIGLMTGLGVDMCVTSQSEQNASPIDSRHDMHEFRGVSIIDDAGGSAAELNLTAVGADGFTFTIINTPIVDYTIEYFAFAGDDITNVALVSMVEPAVAGVLNLDTIGFRPDMALFVCNASGAATLGISDDSRMHFGAFAGSETIVNATWGGGSNDGANPSQAIAYCKLGECIGVVSSDLTSINTRARVTNRRPLGLEVTFDEVIGSGVRETFVLAVKGGQWNIGSFTTSTDLANKTITGLGFNQTPKGGIVVSACHPQSTADIADTGDEFSLGFFTSTSDRAAMAVEEADNVVTADVQSAYEKDQIYLGCDALGGIDARVDINAMAEDSLTFSQSIMDQNGRFAWVLTFADSIKRELIGHGNITGGVLTL